MVKRTSVSNSYVNDNAPLVIFCVRQVLILLNHAAGCRKVRKQQNGLTILLSQRLIGKILKAANTFDTFLQFLSL